MMVGFNERRDQWMDEGFNTFIDIYESDDFKEFGPKRDGEYAPRRGNPVDEILPLLADPDAPVMLDPRRSGAGEVPPPVHLFQIGAGAGAAARADPGTGAFRLGLPQIHRRLGLQASHAVGFLPRHGQRAAARICPGSGAAGIFNNWTLDLAVKARCPAKGGWTKGAVVTIANLDRW